MAKLVVTEQGKQRTLEIDSTDVVEIGRDETCAVRIADPLSSRKHCRILGTLSGFELVDLGSSNGTVHNGHRIERVPLVAGDRIQIGEVRIEFIEEPRSEQATAPLVEPATPTPPPALEKPAPRKPTPAKKSAQQKPAPARKPAAAASSTAGGELPPEPNSDDAPHLVIVDGPFEGRRVALDPPFVIGRKDECNLTLPDRKASGTHARIERQGDRWFVTDLDSGNGLFVGKNRVRKHKLVDGDLILVGDTHLRVRGIPADPSVATSGSASQVFRSVDEGEITEEDLSRLTPRMIEEANRLQWLHTLIVLVSGALIVYFGRSVFIDLTENRLTVSESNLLGMRGSFENPPENGWGDSWAVDAETSDPVTLETHTALGLPHGDHALSVTSRGGDFRSVRLYGQQRFDFTPGESFHLSGQLRSQGFARVGLAMRWFTRRGADLVPLDESYTELDPRDGTWVRLDAAMVPPAHGEPTACQVGILALGAGSLLVDELSLERVERPESDEIALTVGPGTGGLRVGVDPRGLLSVSHGRESWLRRIRLARGPEEGKVPWGQLFPESRTVLETHENGSIRNAFELDGRKVSQVTQIVGGQVRVTYSADLADRAQIILELGRSLAARPSSVFDGEESTRQGVGWEELDGAIGEEWVIGRGANQLILRLGVPGTIELLEPVAARGGLALSWTPLDPPPGGTLDLTIGTVSDRERRRVAESWEQFEAALDARLEGEALVVLEGLEREFPWREDVIERVEQERDRILVGAAAGWEDLRAIVEDLREYPSTPITQVLVERGNEFVARFEGTDEARRARDLVAETERSLDARRGAVDRQRARDLLALANRYFDERRDGVARIYYEWVREDHAGTEEARSAEERLRLIEARE